MPPSDRHQRTEKPTPKRKREAREKGQVSRSPDISAFIGVLGASALLPTLVSDAQSRVTGVFAQSLQVVQNPTTAGAASVLGSGMLAFLEVILPIAAGLAVLGSVANLAQVGLHLSGKALSPQFSRISPKAGFKRLFSSQSLVSLAKQAAKLSLLILLTFSAITGLMHAIPAGTPVPLISTVGIGSEHLLGFVRGVAVIGVGLGVADFLFQRKKLLDTLKMTKQEVKDEARQSQGDPMMKNEIRKRGYQIARSKAIRAVRSADVVVANPTHYAVALCYDKARAAAPIVLAKGEGLLALRIKDEAARALVPVVEDPPLARYLFAVSEEGRPVPPEIYLAVARLLAFIYSLPPSFRGGSIHSYPPSQVPFDPADIRDQDDDDDLVGAARK